jgi:hypothetical protein
MCGLLYMELRQFREPTSDIDRAELGFVGLEIGSDHNGPVHIEHGFNATNTDGNWSPE